MNKLASLLWNNPEMEKNIRAKLRAKITKGGIIIYLLLIAAIAMLMFFGYSEYQKSVPWGEYSKHMFGTIAAFQALLSFIVGAVMISESIASEKEKGSLDFLYMIPSDKWMIITGKILGVPILIYMILGINIPITLYALLAGGLSLINFALFYIIIIFGSLFFYSWALLASAVSPKYSWANSITLIGIITFLVLMADKLACLNPVTYLIKFWGGDPIGNTLFYGVEIYDPVLAVVVYSIFSIWMLTGTRQHLNNHWDSVFTARHIVLFFMIFVFLFWGFNNFSNDFAFTLNILLTASLGLIIPLVLLINDNYSRIRTLMFNNQDRNIPFLARHYFKTIMIILAIVIISALVASLFYKGPTNHIDFLLKYSIFVIFTFIYSMGIYLINLWPGKNQNTIIIGIFAISLIIPVGGLVFFFNPFTLFWEKSQLTLTTALILNLLIAGVIYFLFHKRLKMIQDKIAERFNNTKI